MKNLKYIIAVLSIAIIVNANAQTSTENLKKHINYLASPKLKGRGTGSKGEKLASEYIAKQFKSYGLSPKGTNNTYFQTFTFKDRSNPHDTVGNGAQRKLTNVVGYIDNSAENTIIIGAHYDHLGMGFDHNSLDANPEKKAHYGADDNASGTAGMLEMARIYATNNIKEPYNFLFMAFSGEELGLLGSKKFTGNPTIDLKKVDFMLNFDMIGRLNTDTRKVIVYGVGTSPNFVPAINGIKTDLTFKFDSSGIGPSDHTSFYLENIPVLHFFTGQHPDYHKPSDTPDKINYDGEKTVVDYVIALTDDLIKQPKQSFLTTKANKDDTPKFKVTMGIMPDYAFEGQGVHVDGVTDGKPAALAGIKKGDIIIKLGDIDVTDMTTYMKALAANKKGSVAEVVVMRGTERIISKVEFK
jgi:hypothetical protein